MTAPTHRRRGAARVAWILLWTLQVLLGVLLAVGFGLPKLYGEPFQVQLFTDLGFGQWLRYAVGVLEVAGGIGLLVPRLAGLAAAGLAVVLVGATLTWIIPLGPPVMAVLPGTLLALMLIVVIARRREVAALLSAPRAAASPTR